MNNLLENKEALEMFMSHVEDWKTDTKVIKKAIPDILCYIQTYYLLLTYRFILNIYIFFDK